MSKDPANQEPGTEVAVISRELVAQFAQMASVIPDSEGDGSDRILEQMLAAATWEQLDDPWDADKAQAIAGKRLKILALKRRPSDFRAGLGFFLVVESVDVDNGEMITWITGATSVVGQLVIAWCRGWMPCVVRLVIAERATADGYHPHHLEFLAGTHAGQVDA